MNHDYNPHFCSINVLRKQTLSRRDDFIQIVYNLMCLSNEFGPIRNIMGFDPEGENFAEYKNKVSASEFCEQNGTPFFSDVLEECYSLGYNEVPKYHKIIYLL